MRKFKKFAAMASAVALAACAVAPLAMNVHATATANKITVTNPTGVGTEHKYTAYQIFKGTATGTDTITLTGVQWANAEKSSDFITALKGNTCPIKDDCQNLTDTSTAAAVAKLINSKVNANNVKAFAKFLESQVSCFSKVGGDDAKSSTSITLAQDVKDGNGNITSTPGDGWYLVIDDTSASLSPSGAFSSYLLQNVDASAGAELTFKGDAPTVVKKVQEDDKDVTGKTDIENGYWVEDDKYNDVADYSIGELVPFRLEATLPADTYYADYDHYYLKFTDTLGKGFDVPTEITVKWGENDNQKKKLNADNSWTDSDTGIKATITTDSNTKETTITVEIADVKDTDIAGLTGGSAITVDYSAKLNANAEIGRLGNYNDVDLTYSNNPKNTGEGANDHGDTDTTEEDGVVVFTYGFDVHKYDGSQDKTTTWLANAVFAVKDKTGKYMCETGTDAKVITWESGTTSGDGETPPTNVKKWTTNNSSNIVINGLDAGEYELVEIEQPAGYNKVNPIPFNIVATTSNDQSQSDICAVGTSAAVRTGKQLQALKIQMKKENDAWTDEGALNHTFAVADDPNTDTNEEAAAQNAVMFVENNSGTELPGTGGIGTTMFYIGGGAMVAVAGVFLITKKRMNKKEN